MPACRSASSPAISVPANRARPRPTDLPEDDGNPCTQEVCEGGTGMQLAVTGRLCNDGDPCTTADVCSLGACIGTPIACGAQDDCDDAGVCPP